MNIYCLQCAKELIPSEVIYCGDCFKEKENDIQMQVKFSDSTKARIQDVKYNPLRFNA